MTSFYNCDETKQTMDHIETECSISIGIGVYLLLNILYISIILYYKNYLFYAVLIIVIHIEDMFFYSKMLEFDPLHKPKWCMGNYQFFCLTSSHCKLRLC